MFRLTISTHQQVAVFTRVRSHRSVVEQTTSRTFCGRTHWEVHYARTAILNTPQTHPKWTAENTWKAKEPKQHKKIIKPMIITVWCSTVPPHLGKTHKQAKNSVSAHWPTEIHFKWPPATGSEQSGAPSPHNTEAFLRGHSTVLSQILRWASGTDGKLNFSVVSTSETFSHNKGKFFWTQAWRSRVTCLFGVCWITNS